MTNFTKKIRVLIGAVLAGFCIQASAAIIYDNSTTLLTNRFNPGTFEVGDQLNLAGTERNLQSFGVQFHGANTSTPLLFSGSISLRVRLYLNDGALFNGFASPGTVLYDDTLALGPATYPIDGNFNQSFLPGSLSLGNISTLTLSLTFSGMGSGDVVGPALFNPPTVGSSAADYWERSGGGGAWQLKTFPSGQPPVNFGVRLTAVPDTTGIGIFLLSLFGLFLFSRIVRGNVAAKS